MEAPRSRWIEGRATFTTVLSSMIMNSAKHIAPSVHQRRLPSWSARRRGMRGSSGGRGGGGAGGARGGGEVGQRGPEAVALTGGEGVGVGLQRLQADGVDVLDGRQPGGCGEQPL